MRDWKFSSDPTFVRHPRVKAGPPAIPGDTGQWVALALRCSRRPVAAIYGKVSLTLVFAPARLSSGS
jgi:hypothetical protein